MINLKYCTFVGLGAVLVMMEDRISFLSKLGLLGGAWLISGGFQTVKIVCCTLPRDLTAVSKLVRLVFHIKKSEKVNLTVPKMFFKTVQKFPNRVLFYFQDQTWTFQQVEELSNQIAHFFLKEGFERGDTVAVFMENRPEFVCTWLGLAKIGVIPALINYNLRQEPLFHTIQVAKCKAVIYGSELSQSVAEIFGLLINGSRFSFPTYCTGSREENSILSTKVPGTKNLDLCTEQQSVLPVDKTIQDSINFKDKLMFIYTSGTTGMPKAAVIKHARYILAGGGLTIMIGVKKDDVVYCPLPLYHSVGGMISLSGCMNHGISMVMRDKFSASSYWKDCVKYNVTAAQYIGEICRYLLNTPECEQEGQHRVRLMFGNGLRPEIWEDFIHRFNIPNIAEFYGSTEGNSNILNFDNTVGAVGFVPVLFSSILPLGPIKVDEDGNAIRDPQTGLCIRCKPGEPGEFVGIIQQNHPVREFTGYSDKESTQRKVLSDVWRKGDQCFRSGDILVSDKYGYLYFKDRKGDTFRWKGENVSTAEVEGVISKVSGLTDVVVYGVKVPDCDGRVGMAAIVEQAESGSLVDLENLAKNVIVKLPNYARPIFVRVVPELDMTGTYKLKKREMQLEGYDPNTIEDKMYFLDQKEKKYVPLTPELYQKITEKKVRL